MAGGARQARDYRPLILIELAPAQQSSFTTARAAIL